MEVMGRVKFKVPEVEPWLEENGYMERVAYVVQIAEVTPNTGPGARGLVLPAVSRRSNPGENQLLPDTPTRGRPARAKP